MSSTGTHTLATPLATSPPPAGSVVPHRMPTSRVGQPPGGRGRLAVTDERTTMADRSWGFRTRALHAGGAPDPTTGARAVPIYQTTSFVFESADDAANLFALQKYGNVYSRIAN